MPPHPLTNFEFEKFFQNEPRFNGVYSRINLTEIKDGAYIINLDEYSDVAYFDSFRVEEIKAFVDRCLSITTNIFRTKAYDLIMCGYFCFGFIDFMLARKTLIEFTNLFLQNSFKKNNDIILSYFMSNV